MSEELLKELLEETKKQNEIQESIKREMELQNDLMIFFVENAQEVVSNYRYSSVGNKLAKGRLYARLSEEDRSIMERSQDFVKDEAEMYHRISGGFNDTIMARNKGGFEDIIKGMQVEILNDVYTEEELYNFFARAFERSGLSKDKLNYVWEDGWQDTKRGIIDEDERNGIDDEDSRKIREMYENRITKNMVK